MHAVAVEDSRLLHGIPAARVALIERIARSAGSSAVRRQLSQRFVRSYYHGVAEEDLAARNPRQLSRAALAHLQFATRRSPSRSLVRVFNPQTATRRLREPAHARAHGHRRHAVPRRLPRHGVQPAPSWPCTSSCTRCYRYGGTGTGACWTLAPTGPARRTRSPGSSTKSTASPILRNCTSCSRTSRPRSRDVRVAVRTGRRCASACARSSASWRTTRRRCPRTEVSEAASSARLDGRAALRVPRLPALRARARPQRGPPGARARARAWASSARRVARHTWPLPCCAATCARSAREPRTADHHQGELERHRASRRAISTTSA